MNEQATMAAPARVLLLSHRWSKSTEWHQRGLVTMPPRVLAFDRLMAEPPDALVLDARATASDQHIDCWQAHQLPDIPVVVVDEHATPAEVVEWFAQGADDVITLPPDTSEVAARVASILRRSRRGPDRLPPVLLFDAVEVDTVRRVVRRPNEGAPDVPTELPLSPTEFSLLVTLIRAGGRVCTYRELAASGWESDSSASPHYLRLYMRFLRRKIEADPSQPRWLLNVRGVGYRLAPGVAGGTRRLIG